MIRILGVQASLKECSSEVTRGDMADVKTLFVIL